MTISTEDLRKLVAGNRFSSIAEVRDLATELLAARAKMEAEGERAARICEVLHRRGVLPEKWPDYFRVRDAGDLLLAKEAAQ